MKKIFFVKIYFLFFSFLSCNAQKEVIKFSYEQNEVLKTFLRQQKLYTYVDKHFFNRNRIRRFVGDYKNNRRLYRVSDSVCKTSSDTIKLKFYCPISDSFKKNANLFTDNELNIMLKKYNIDNKKVLLELDTLISNTTLKEHSLEYYNQIDYSKFDGIPNLNEFPSIRIDNIYFNETKSAAVIAYTLVYERINSSSSGFYLLEKKDNIWWKPLGNLKF